MIKHVLKIWDRLKSKKMKDCYNDLFLKCDVLLLADKIEKLRKSSLKIMGYGIFIIWVH